AGFIRYLFDVDASDSGLYDLVINTEHLNASTATHLIIETVKSLESQVDASESLLILKQLTLAKKVEIALSDVISGSSYVDVQTDNQGVITLEGVVRSEEEKRSIENKALSVHGVTAVMNHLDVRQISPRDEWPYRVRF
ncbi:MAG: BON domain-containing protein, partial [Nitrospira sp.]|nr:BON domain-containing protein [Nitrospira sp.]